VGDGSYRKKVAAEGRNSLTNKGKKEEKASYLK
jgi:hypothetical protein